MNESHKQFPDEERSVSVDDETEFELPPPTLDDDESVEVEVDEVVLEERSAAIEIGEIDP